MTIRKLAFDPLGVNVSKLSSMQLRIEFPPAYHYGMQKCDLELHFKTDLQVGLIMTSSFDFVQSRYASRGLPQYFSMQSAPYESDASNAPLLYSFGGLLSSNFPPSKLGLMLPQGCQARTVTAPADGVLGCLGDRVLYIKNDWIDQEESSDYSLTLDFTFAKEQKRTSCIPCEGLKYKGAADAQCLDCPAGTFVVASKSGCDSCPIGKYSLASDGVCSEWKFNTATGSSYCRYCQALRTEPSGGSSCSDCPKGSFYIGREISTGCQLCPIGILCVLLPFV
eukprot:768646-Hanusia_phi.AAC.3